MWDLRESTRDGQDGAAVGPVITVGKAHGEEGKVKGRRKGKATSRTVTSVVYLPGDPYTLLSSGSFDGCVSLFHLLFSRSSQPRDSKLRKWDLRLPMARKAKKTLHSPIEESQTDPTALNGSRRPRGISSLALGSNDTAGVLFGLSADSRIHTYTLPLDSPHEMYEGTYGHPHLLASAFYVRLSVSPCGRWLASGSSSGCVCLFDVSRSRSRSGWGLGSMGAMKDSAVELVGQSMSGEVGAVDWADGCLAACADDGTVRVWRPDVDIYRACLDDPTEALWEWSWATQRL